MTQALLGPVSALRPYREPADLILDFANMAILDPRLTPIRASEKTYIDERGIRRMLAANVGILTNDPVYGRCLEIEPQSTNQILNSDNPSAWNGSQQTPLPASLVTIAGVKLIKLRPSTTSASHYTDRTFAVQDEGTPVSAQLCLLAGEHRWVRVEMYLNGASYVVGITVDMYAQSFTVNQTQEGVRITLQKLAFGVCLLLIDNMTFVAGSTGPRMRLVTLSKDNSGAVYAGNDADGFYAGAAQVEFRRTCTSFIPTLGSTVTRSGEHYLLESDIINDAWNPSSGMALLDAMFAQETSGMNALQINLASGATDRIEFRRSTGGTGNMYAQIVIGGTAASGTSSRVWPVHNRGVVGARWNSAETRASAIGIAIIAPTSLIVSGAISNIRLGYIGAGVHLKARSFRLCRSSPAAAADFTKLTES